MAAAKSMPIDGAMRTAIAMVAALGLAFALAASLLLDWSSGLGVAVGALVATLNLWAFAHIGRGVLGGSRNGRLWGALGALKLVVLLAAVYFLLNSGLVSGIALVAGYAALPLGASIANFVGPRPGEDDPQLQSAAGDLSADLVTGPQPDTGTHD